MVRGPGDPVPADFVTILSRTKALQQCTATAVGTVCGVWLLSAVLTFKQKALV